jgi:hypothetical protein
MSKAKLDDPETFMLALAPFPVEVLEVELVVAAVCVAPLLEEPPPEPEVPVAVAVAVADDAVPVASATAPHWEAFQTVVKPWLQFLDEVKLTVR